MNSKKISPFNFLVGSIGLVAGVGSFVVSLFTVPDETHPALPVVVGGGAFFAILAVSAVVVYRPFGKLLQTYSKYAPSSDQRFFNIDIRDYSIAHRIAAITTAQCRIFFYRVSGSLWLRIGIFYLVVVLILAWLSWGRHGFSFSYDTHSDTQNNSEETNPFRVPPEPADSDKEQGLSQSQVDAVLTYFISSGFVWLTLMGSTAFVTGWMKKRLEKDPKTCLSLEIRNTLDQNTPQLREEAVKHQVELGRLQSCVQDSPFVAGADEFKPDSLAHFDLVESSNRTRIRRMIAHHDRGPVSVCSINAHDLLGLLDLVWSDEVHKNKKFRWVICNPFTFSITARNRRLNGRYCERYAVPYLRLLLKWHAELDESKNESRLHIRIIDHVPTWRLVGSADRIFVQKYPEQEHGHTSDTLVLDRVYDARKADEVLCTPSNPGLAVSLQGPESHLYQAYMNNFEALWSSEDARKPQAFSVVRREDAIRFAEFCKVPQMKYKNRVTGREVLYEVCKNLNLEEEWNAASVS